jgi:flavin reductase (DIM6/NTAB) family NADH-FMN oxidoreductase RutF
MECTLYQKQKVGKGEDLRLIVFGEVLLVHLKEGIWESGKIRSSVIKAVGYLGGNKYCRATEAMSLRRG